MHYILSFEIVNSRVSKYLGINGLAVRVWLTLSISPVQRRTAFNITHSRRRQSRKPQVTSYEADTICIYHAVWEAYFL